MNRMILPLENAYFYTYSKHGAMTSVMGTNPKAKMWAMYTFFMPIYTRYSKRKIQWYELRPCEKNTVWVNEWEMCPFINSVQSTTEDIANKGICQYLIDNLSSGRYIYIDLETSMIKGYHGRRGNHDLLISGVDQEDGFFVCNDYFDIHYESKLVPFEEINASFEAKRNREYRKNFNYSWKLIEDVIELEFEKADFYRKLYEVIHPNSFIYYAPDIDEEVLFTSGIETYKDMKRDLQIGKVDYDDTKFFCVIRDHLNTLDTLLAMYGFIRDEKLAERLVQIVEAMISLSIKYTIVKDKKIGRKIENLLDELYLSELKYISDIIKLEDRFW